MKRAIAAAALIGALLNGAPARAAGTLVGVGNVSGPCSGVVLIQGVNVAGNVWAFSFELILNPTTGSCTVVAGLVAASGAWTGGCVQNSPELACVDASSPGTVAVVPVSVCATQPVVIGCFNGSATVLRL